MTAETVALGFGPRYAEFHALVLSTSIGDPKPQRYVLMSTGSFLETEQYCAPKIRNRQLRDLNGQTRGM